MNPYTFDLLFYFKCMLIAIRDPYFNMCFEKNVGSYFQRLVKCWAIYLVIKILVVFSILRSFRIMLIIFTNWSVPN
jgi:hypothetical protein